MENDEDPYMRENKQDMASRIEISECWSQAKTEEVRQFVPVPGKISEDQSSNSPLILSSFDSQHNCWRDKIGPRLLEGEALCQPGTVGMDYGCSSGQRPTTTVSLLEKQKSRDHRIIEHGAEETRIIRIIDNSNTQPVLHGVTPMPLNLGKMDKESVMICRPQGWNNSGHNIKTIDINKRKTTEPNLRNWGLFQCSFCNFVFQDLSELVQHQETHNQEKFRGIGHELVQSEQQEEALCEWRRYQCIVCDKTFCKQSSLVTHLRIHTGEKPFSCHVCRRKFNQRTSLTVHLRTHTGEAPFCCNKCNKSFRQQSNLTHHMKSHQQMDEQEREDWNEETRTLGIPLMYLVSEGDDNSSEVWGTKILSNKGDREEDSTICKRPYVCGHCFKRFTHQSNLMVHQRIHTGDRSYCCQECGKQFTRRTSLMVHLRGHTGEMPYSCQECGKSFRQQSNLLYHMKSHTGQNELKSKVTQVHSNKQTLKPSRPLIGPSGQYLDRDPPQSISVESRDERRLDENQMRVFQCSQCYKWFPNTASLLLHQKFHLEQPNTIIQGRDVQSPYTIHNSPQHTYAENLLSSPKEQEVCPQPRFKHPSTLEGNLVSGIQSSPEGNIINQPGQSSEYQRIGNHSVHSLNLKGYYQIRGRGRPRKSIWLGHGQSSMGALGPGKALHRCWKCPRRFNHKSNLIVHLRIHTGERPFQCWKCDKRFRQQSNLVQHLRNHEETHGNEILSGPRMEDSKQKQSGKTLQNMMIFQPPTISQARWPFLPVGEGNQMNQNVQLFEAPQAIHVDEETSVNECMNGSMEAESSSSDDRSFKCNSCFKTFNHKSNLLVHERIHSGDKTYRCQDCGKQFSQRTSLMVHLRTHTGEMPYSCQQCRRRFRQQSNLLYHIKTNTVLGQLKCTIENLPISSMIPRMESVGEVSIGQEIEPTLGQAQVWLDMETNAKIETAPATPQEAAKENYQCLECDKIFTHQSNLLVHQRIHSGERAYRCHECNRQFSQRTSLMIHLRTHTGEMPYACQCCGKRFRQQSNLLYHLKSHAGQVTGIEILPGLDYATPKARGRPRKIESNDERREKRIMPRGKRTYKCTECPRRYNLMSNLVAHQRSHDRQPLFTCSECGESFLQQSYLTVHKKLHTKRDPPQHDGEQLHWKPNL
ncbi:zinc finger protein 721-like [Bombina bombina]|uniref:zinc finger protein 721-like n=1 Tax=Bombina bombina TaxID=8345 RepID=UPI00235ACE95|nr:zinc finger protein 721-like [Bombina bombina]